MSEKIKYFFKIILRFASMYPSSQRHQQLIQIENNQTRLLQSQLQQILNYE
jgi:hypothetical protein